MTWAILSLAIWMSAGAAAAQPPAPMPEILPNGGFEQGLEGWRLTGPWEGASAGSPAGAAIGLDGRSGERCLQLDTRGRPGEVNAHAGPLAVKGGSRYRVEAWTRLHAPAAAGFKVTVDWLDGDERHIAYANDWTGSARAGDWAIHVAEVSSPEEARAARILLGVQPGVRMDFDDVSFRQIGARIVVASFGVADAVLRSGEPSRALLTVLNAGGETARGLRAATAIGSGAPMEQALPDLAPGATSSVAWVVPPQAPGLATASARVWSENAGEARAGSASPVLAAQSAPSLRLRSGEVELRFHRLGVGHGPIEIVAMEGKRERTLGVLPAAVWVEPADGPRAPLPVRFARQRSGASGSAGGVAIQIWPAGPGRFRLRCVASLSGPLRGLTFPEVHAGWRGSGTKKQSALFPGLEYLTASEESSSPEHTGPDLANRTAPHPNKVTVPLMAVVQNGWALGIAWNPLQKWDGKRYRPQPVFSSPNRIEGRDDHLMALMVPAVPEHLDENARSAARPYEPHGHVTLEAELFAVRVRRDVSEVVEDWYRRNPLPALPDITTDLRPHWAYCAERRAAAWDPERKQWPAEAHRTPAWHPDIALALWNWGVRNAGARAAEARREAMESLAEAVRAHGPGAAGFPLSLHLGDPIANLPRPAEVAGILRAQRTDGTWPFVPNEETRSLGRQGDTALGICADPTLRLLRYAAITGDQTALEAGLRGIAAMRRSFQRPAGGEVWEVPLHAPNLRAAAVAVECGVIAYELTGRLEHLEFARYWARTGLPFVYTWRAADREAMRYATISVFGTTFYSVPWFGRPVQWVGLVYAQAITTLARHDPSFPWRHIATGIVLSCVQQQRLGDRPEVGNPMPGFFPDSYNLLDGQVLPAWIGPQGMMTAMEALMGQQAVSQSSAGPAGRRILLSSAAAIRETVLGSGGLRLMLAYPAGRACATVAFCVSRPTAVLADGRALPEVTDLSGAREGWWWSAERRALVVRHAFRTSALRLEVRGATFARGDNRGAAAIPNGDFEDGLRGWTGAGRLVEGGAASGRWCIEIDATGRDDEAQCQSEAMRVRPGVSYRLDSRVRAMGQTAGYKVTIQWEDAQGGVLRYDNDWAGTDVARAWSRHGGIFAAPSGAARAVILLGVRPGARYRFDAIALTEVR